MPYSVRFTKHALRQLERLPQEVRVRIIRAGEELERNPHPAGAVKIAGLERCWRIRVGDFRVVYQVRDRELLVLVVRLGDRKEVYKDMLALRKAIADWESSRK